MFSKTVVNANPEPTLIELTEQMRGRVKLKGHGHWRQPHEIEITLTTEPVPVADLIRSIAISRSDGTGTSP